MSIPILEHDLAKLKSTTQQFKKMRVRTGIWAIKQLWSDKAFKIRAKSRDELFPERFMPYSDCLKEDFIYLNAVKANKMVGVDFDELVNCDSKYRELKLAILNERPELIDSLSHANTNYLDLMNM